MDLPAQISLILTSCSLPMLLLEIASDAKDPLASRAGTRSLTPPAFRKLLEMLSSFRLPIDLMRAASPVASYLPCSLPH
jgi:hypothetical protein